MSVVWGNVVSDHRANNPKTGKPLATIFIFICFYYYYIFLMVQKTLIMKQDHINCLHSTKEYWLLLFGSTTCYSPWSSYVLKKKNPWQLFLVYFCFYYYYVFLVFQTNIIMKQRRTGECFLGESCVISWSSYSLKRVIYCHFYSYLL